MSTEPFPYDFFLSYSAADKAVERFSSLSLERREREREVSKFIAAGRAEDVAR